MTDDTDNICPQCGGPRRAERDGQRRYRPGSIVEDPFYTGPDGHCPPGLCAECWEAHWSEVLAAMEAAEACIRAAREGMLGLPQWGEHKTPRKDEGVRG